MKRWKRIGAALLGALLACTLGACGGSAPSEAVFGNSSPESSPAASSSADPDLIRVGLITGVGGLRDAGYNESAWRGLQNAQADFPISVTYLETTSEVDFDKHFQKFTQEGVDLIICPGGYMAQEVAERTATEHPAITVALIDAYTDQNLSNLYCINFRQDQVAYLMGVAAAKTTKTGIIGFVVGSREEFMHSFAYGYAAGALDTDPAVKILHASSNSFADLSAGKTAALSMAQQGVDVIFHAAGAAGVGVIEGCQESGIWAIGADIDQNPLAPGTVLTSAIKRIDTACYTIINGYLDDTLTHGNIVYGMAEGGIDFSPTVINLSEEALKAMDEAKNALRENKINIPLSEESFYERFGVVFDFI